MLFLDFPKAFDTLIPGILGSSPLQTVEKLDIRANKWVYVAEMSIPRVDAGAGSISLL
jgi:hypothetical protein